MDFWTSARVVFHGTTECLRLDHTYPAKVELHIDWCQSILESFRSLQLLNVPDDNAPDDNALDDNASDDNAPDDNTPYADDNTLDENLNRWIAIFEEILQQQQSIADTIARGGIISNSGFELEIEVQNVKTGGRPWKDINLNAIISLLTNETFSTSSWCWLC